MNLFTRKMQLFCVSNIMVSFVCTGFLAVPSYAINMENLEENSHEISLATSDTEPASRIGDEGVVIGALEIVDDESPLDEEEEVKPVVKKVTSKAKKTTVTRVVTKKEVASTKTYTPAKYNAVTGNAVVEYAKKYLGLRYVSGGNSLSTGTDCSGFTKLIYKEFGVNLSRSASGQVGNGTYVRKADLQKGDLVFYGKKSGGGVTHVGIYMGNGQVIHESNHRDGVKISSVNMMRYITARRVINSKAIKIAEEKEEKKIEEQKQVQQETNKSITNSTDQTVKSSDVVETVTDKKEEIIENNNVIENVQTTTNSQTETTSVNQSGVVETKEVKEEPKVVETKEETTNVSDTSKSDAVKEEPKKEETKTKEETTKVEETSQEVTE